MIRFLLLILILVIQTSQMALARAEEPPTSWVDKDTGHRVIRLTQEAGSSGLYFNVNAYSPDGKLMIYVAPDGIHVLELATLKTRLLVPNPPDNPAGNGGNFRNGVHAIVVGKKTNSIFFTKSDPRKNSTSVYKADMYTGEVKELVTLPPRASLATVNADETLGVGT
jgi:oligogalacturonide lyase